MRLDQIAKVIRSKNAGPCLLTLDVMLPDEAAFAYVAARVGALRRQVARRYGRSENLKHIEGQALPENTSMLEMCRELGFEISEDPRDRTVKLVRLKLRP